MNLYEHIKDNQKLAPKRTLNESCKRSKKKAIKESSENGNLFWDKVRNNEIAEGMYVKTRGAGDAKILDVDSRSDYILVKLPNSEYQPYIAAWAPEWYEDDKKGNLTWGQGHYFSDEGSAKEYFEEKSGGRHWNINESCKGKKNRKAIKEEERPVIKLSNEYVEIPVRKGSITAGPSIAREINSKRPNKKIVKRVDENGKELNESIYELSPEYGGRNSYYGKAQIEVNPDGKTLYSYGTPIMTIKDGQIKMLCGEWALTNTTIRHIREFMQQEGLDPVPKAKLVKLINEQGINESCKKPKKKTIKEAEGSGLPKAVIDELEEELTNLEQASINENCLACYESYKELYDNYSDGPLKDYAKECEANGVDYKTFIEPVYKKAVNVVLGAATNMVHGVK